MNGEVGSIVPSAVVLGAAGAMALFLTLTRGWAVDSTTHRRGAVRVALATILSQAAHFAEELLTGFHERFPALFGLVPIPLRVFVLFNLAWLVVWALCVWGLAARRRAALFPLWFLGIACVANGVAHPSLSSGEATSPDLSHLPSLASSESCFCGVCSGSPRAVTRLREPPDDRMMQSKYADKTLVDACRPGQCLRRAPGRVQHVLPGFEAESRRPLSW